MLLEENFDTSIVFLNGEKYISIQHAVSLVGHAFSEIVFWYENKLVEGVLMEDTFFLSEQSLLARVAGLRREKRLQEKKVNAANALRQISRAVSARTRVTRAAHVSISALSPAAISLQDHEELHRQAAQIGDALIAKISLATKGFTSTLHNAYVLSRKALYQAGKRHIRAQIQSVTLILRGVISPTRRTVLNRFAPSLATFSFLVSSNELIGNYWHDAKALFGLRINPLQTIQDLIRPFSLGSTATSAFTTVSLFILNALYHGVSPGSSSDPPSVSLAGPPIAYSLF